MTTGILNEESVGFNGVYMNTFHGGVERGQCFQITMAQSGTYIQLTRSQLERLFMAMNEVLVEGR